MATSNQTCNSSNASHDYLLNELEELVASLRTGFYPSAVMASVGFVLQLILLLSVGYQLHYKILPWKRFAIVLNQTCADIVFSLVAIYAAILNIQTTNKNLSHSFEKVGSSTIPSVVLFGLYYFGILCCSGNYAVLTYFQALALYKPLYYATRLSKRNVVIHIIPVWMVALVVSSLGGAAIGADICAASASCLSVLTNGPIVLVTLASCFSLINYVQIMVVLRSRLAKRALLQAPKIMDSDSNASGSQMDLVAHLRSLWKFTRNLCANFVVLILSNLIPAILLWIVMAKKLTFLSVSSSDLLSNCDAIIDLLRAAINYESSLSTKVLNFGIIPLMVLRVIADPIIYFLKVPALNDLLRNVRP